MVTGASRSINSQDRESADVAKALVKTALALQLRVAALYHMRARESGVLVSNTGSADVERVLVTLYASCGLIAVRTVFRTVEYFAVASLRVRREWFFWVFEASVILANSALLNWRHRERSECRASRVDNRENGGYAHVLVF